MSLIELVCKLMYLKTKVLSLLRNLHWNFIAFIPASNYLHTDINNPVKCCELFFIFMFINITITIFLSRIYGNNVSTCHCQFLILCSSSGSPVSIGSPEAHGFLTNSRPKRSADPKWHRGNPDFQSYYRFYNSIGHIEGVSCGWLDTVAQLGFHYSTKKKKKKHLSFFDLLLFQLYEIDRIRMLYQQMRHLELVYGPDASSYQNVLGVLTTTAAPSTTTQPPPPPTTPASTPDPLENAERTYLCNPKDPLCKPQIVYLPTGAVPVLCDPRLNPACRPKTEEEIKAAAPPPPPAPPAPKESVQPPPPAISKKGMEYDCDPYWDPDCLIDHPPRPIQETSTPEAPAKKTVVKEEVAKAEESVPVAPATQKTLYPYFDPYDFKRDLYDLFRYANPAPEE